MTYRQASARSIYTPRRPVLQWRTLAPTSTPIRSKSDKSEIAAKVQPLRRSAIATALGKLFTYCGVFIVSSGVIVVAFFIYDASTYHESTTAADIPVSELALNPRRGGPKNLPVADVLVGDYDSESMLQQKDKPRLVILGTGWGSIALLKNLNPADYHVTVVSPTNYFLFTPMLPSATVGTLGLRSLVEPVRRIIERVNGHFLKAYATDVDFSAKLVEVSQVDNDGVRKNFYLPYDKLVVGVGMFILLNALCLQVLIVSQDVSQTHMESRVLSTVTSLRPLTMLAGSRTRYWRTWSWLVSLPQPTRSADVCCLS